MVFTYLGIVDFSVTRFGKFSPLWLNCIGVWQFGKGLFSIWQIFEPTLQHSYAIGKIFIFVHGQISKKLSSRLVTLYAREHSLCKWKYPRTAGIHFD